MGTECRTLCLLDSNDLPDRSDACTWLSLRHSSIPLHMVCTNPDYRDPV